MNFAMLTETGLCVPWIQAMLHFLWQGLVIAALAEAVARCLPRTAARWRYLVYLAALVLMAGCVPVTFGVLHWRGSGAVATVQTFQREVDSVGSLAPAVDPASLPAEREVAPASTQAPRMDMPTVSREPAEETTPAEAAAVHFDWRAYTPYLTAAYLLGVVVMLVRLLLALGGGNRLRRCARPVDDADLLETVKRQARLLGLRFVPVVAYCERVAVPAVVGVVRPMIVLPVSFCTGLLPDQVQAILTHELAHIRRYDHLVNLLQRLIEAALYFHPAVWYVSRRLSAERENICDDMVVAIGQQRLHYAESLLRMAELGVAIHAERRSATPVALSAAGSPSRLRRRILRLLGGDSHENVRLSRSWPLALVLVAAAVLTTSLFVHAAAEPAGKEKVAAAPSGPEDKAVPRVVLLPQSWGQVSAGLQSRLMLDCPRPWAGERIHAYLDVRNVSDKPIELVWAGNLGPFLQVNREGRNVPRSNTREVEIYAWSKPYVLEPGKQAEAWTALLTREFDLSQPGGYSFQWGEVPAKYSVKGRVPPPSNVVKLNLAPAEAASKYSAQQPKWLGGEWSGDPIYQSSGEWSKSSGGLETRLTVPDDARFSAGGPIPMRIELRNVGDRPVRYYDARGYWGGAIKVSDPNGKDLPFLAGPVSTFSRGPVIKPHEQVVLDQEFDLAGYYYLRKPGTYTVRYEGGDRYGDNDPPTPSSPPLKIEVVNHPAAQADGDAVGKLLAGLPRDWSLWGGTTIGTDLRQPGWNWTRVPAGAVQLVHKTFLPKGRAGPEGVLPIVIWITRDRAETVDGSWQGGDDDLRRFPTDYLGSNRHYHVYAFAPPSAVKAWPTVLDDLRKMLQVSSAPPAGRPGNESPPNAASWKPIAELIRDLQGGDSTLFYYLQALVTKMKGQPPAFKEFDRQPLYNEQVYNLTLQCLEAITGRKSAGATREEVLKYWQDHMERNK
jgi:beta-lactamase regulating signal transducer with metallopeptidase domain